MQKKKKNARDSVCVERVKVLTAESHQTIKNKTCIINKSIDLFIYHGRALCAEPPGIGSRHSVTLCRINSTETGRTDGPHCQVIISDQLAGYSHIRTLLM